MQNHRQVVVDRIVSR